MPSFVEVAVPVPLHRTFTYSVPEELMDTAQIGARVSVPFGRRTMTGVIIDEKLTSDVKGIRNLKDVLDDIPLFSEEMLQLAEWISQYYITPIGETLRTMLPQGMAPSSSIRIELSPSADEIDMVQLRRSAPRQAAIITALYDHPAGVKLSYLQQKVGHDTLSSQLIALEEKGWIRRSFTEASGTEARTVRAVRILPQLMEDEGQLQELFNQLDRQAPKQSAIMLFLYSQFERHDGAPIPVTDVLKSANASASALKSLEEKGAIEVSQLEVSRESVLDTELDSVGIVEKNDNEIIANSEQEVAIKAIQDGLDKGYQAYLLYGVTGSGKTHVYIEAIKEAIRRGKKGLMLVPEIALTVQLVERFRVVFGDRIVLLHSRMSDGERFDGWQRAAAGECDLVIGPRSALFAPLRNVGVIIVDEEHESSYKQYDAHPRYNARDTAIVRAGIEKCSVVLGSATPSVESFYNAEVGKYRLLELPNRIDGAKEPEMVLVDTQTARKQNLMRGHLSTRLIADIQKRLEKKEGTILFQNRRGFSARLECTNCAHSPACPNCSVTLTFHKASDQLRCHYCGYSRARERVCEVCGAADLRQPGIGTERAEEELKEHLPEARIRRMDLDTTSRKGAHKNMLAEFGRGEIDILLGTQMVAKGLDFPRVSLVGVISADTQLMLPDFRSAERTFQLITQVAGRAGRRSETPGEVIIQTGHPEHPAIQSAFRRDYPSMYEQELHSRRQLVYPPFARFIVIEIRSKDQTEAQTHARQFRSLLPGDHPAVEIMGPTAALIWKLRNWYRYQIIVKNFKQTDPAGRAFYEMYNRAMASYSERHAKKSVEIFVDVDAQGTM